MMYYTTVTGWMVNYFGKFLTGAFHAGMDTESVVGEFGAMLSNPGEMTLWTELVVVAGFLICSFGLQNGLERVSKVMMLALLALIVVLAVHSLTLPGAAEGMKFYLLPSMDSIRKKRPWHDHRRRDEPVVLHAQPRHCRHGDLRQLYVGFALPPPARPCTSARSTRSSP